MCIGPTVPLPGEHAAERLAIVQDMYTLFQEQAAAHGAELELFDAGRAFVIWPDAAKATNDDVEATFAGMQAVLDERREELARRAGRPLAFKAGVATGALVTAELSGAGRRQVARDGPVIDRASEIFDALDEPRIQYDTEA